MNNHPRRDAAIHIVVLAVHLFEFVVRAWLAARCLVLAYGANDQHLNPSDRLDKNALIPVTDALLQVLAGWPMDRAWGRE